MDKILRIALVITIPLSVLIRYLLSLGSKEKLAKEAIIWSFLIGSIFFVSFFGLVLLQGEHKLALGGDSLDLGSTGQIGDFVGGLVGTIWALMGSFLLYLTLIKQEENSKQANKAIALQQFDSMCFNLIQLHNEMSRNLVIKNWISIKWAQEHKSIELKGIQIFEYVAIEFAEIYNNSSEYTHEGAISRHAEEIGYNDLFQNSENLGFKRSQFGKNRPTDDQLNAYPGVKKIRAIYDYYYQQHKSVFAQYFRNLYQAVRLINEYEGLDSFYLNMPNKLSEIKKDRLKILRAQLSPYEIVVLWYNLQMPLATDFFELAIDTELLKNIDFSTEIVESELLIQQHKYLKY